MKKQYIFILLFHLAIIVNSQTALPIFSVSNLPSLVNESSGVEKTATNRLFTHNDSGGQPDLYEIDSAGALIRTLKISNATNIDWEELAQDDSGRVYVGDFGNNNNNRSATSGNGLKIYRVNNPNLITGTTTVAGIINFEYKDRNFSAPATNHNFDMEGFFFFNDSLHLFTKNRTSPTNGWIKHYILPSVPGTYTATVVDSFNNGGVRITAADISPNKRTVALLAENRIYLFQCFKGSKFISTGTNTVLTIPQTQKEALVFANDSMIYITDENTGAGTGRLYRANLSPHIYKPLSSTSIVNKACPGLSNGNIALTVVGGVPTYSFTWSNSATTAINSSLSSGNYSVTISDSKGCVYKASYAVTNYTVNTPVISQFGSVLTSNIVNTNQWYFNSGVLTGQTNDTLITSANGSYYTVVLDANGCSTSSNTITITSTGIKAYEASNMIMYYNGTDYFVENRNLFMTNIEVTDILGHQIFIGVLNPGEKKSYKSERQVILVRAFNEDLNYSYYIKLY